jgi:RHS repeat-associated protein
MSSSAGTITTGYNALGQTTSYTAPASSGTNTTTTSYTIDGQVAAVNDGKGTTAYTYNGTDNQGHAEHRGLITSESTGVSGDGNFTGSYDADGNLTSENYPNGVVAALRYDGLDETTSLSYSYSGTNWETFQASYNDFGQIVGQSSPESSQVIGYDQDGRISQVADTGDGTCATRVYGYDPDSNRTSLNTYPADSNGSCTTSTAAVSLLYTHDQADRLTDAGYTYDTMGRTTTVPAGDTYDTASGPTSLALTYYADDMVHTETQDGVADTFSLDPSERVLGESNSSTGVTATNIYGDDSDSPVWTSNSNGTWSRDAADLDGNLSEIETANDTGHATIQLTDLHGDVVATVSDSTPSSGPSSYNEETEFGAPRAGKALSGAEYGWLGGKLRSSADLSGLTLMGARLYNPETGRFTSVDPISGGNANAYDYPQDPVDGYDLSGMVNEGEGGGVGGDGAVGSGAGGDNSEGYFAGELPQSSGESDAQWEERNNEHSEHLQREKDRKAEREKKQQARNARRQARAERREERKIALLHRALVKSFDHMLSQGDPGVSPSRSDILKAVGRHVLHWLGL